MKLKFDFSYMVFYEFREYVLLGVNILEFNELEEDIPFTDYCKQIIPCARRCILEPSCTHACTFPPLIYNVYANTNEDLLKNNIA